jgi:hypothetical protein
MANSDARISLDVWLAVNERGDYEVGTSEEDAATRLTEKQDGYRCRMVKLAVLVMPPAATEVPDDVGHVVDINNATD